MRFLILLAVIFFAISFICVQVPTALIGVGALGWLVLGLLSWALDALVGGAIPISLRRPPQ